MSVSVQFAIAIYKINPLHVKAHLNDKENAMEFIEKWCKTISV